MSLGFVGRYVCSVILGEKVLTVVGAPRGKLGLKICVVRGIS
jgi:hypothetical protein